MKTTFIVIFSHFCICLSAQIVGTCAGIRGSVGYEDGSYLEATFNNPHGIAVSQTGTIYVCDRFNHIIRKISPLGEVSTLAGNPGLIGDADGQGSEALFYEPWGLCVDAQENVYVSDTRNNKIKKIDPEGNVITYAGTGNFGTTNGAFESATFGLPVGIESDGAGTIYVADHSTHIIRKLSPDGQVSTLAGIPYTNGDQDGPGNTATFNKPYGLTLDLQGNIIVADEWNHKIRRISPEGEVSTIAGTGETGGDNGAAETSTFHFPWDVTVDSLGNIFVVDGLNYVVRKISPEGEVSILAGTLGSAGSEDGTGTDARFSGAAGIAYSPLTRELFIADAFNNLVRKITDPGQGVFLANADNQQQFCPQQNNQIDAFPLVYDQFHFFLNDQLLQSGTQSYFDLSNIASGSHTLKVVANLDTFTVESDVFEFEVYEVVKPTIDTVGATTFFEGDSVILVASFGEEYFWSNGADTPTITVKESGSYAVEVIDQNDCPAVSDMVLVTVRAELNPIEIFAFGMTTFCEGASVLLSANYSENIQWLKDGWPIEEGNTPEYEVMNSGSYRVQFTDTDGTTIISDPVEINVLKSPKIDFRTDKKLAKPGEFIQFIAIADSTTSLEWDFGDGEQIIIENSPLYSYQEEGLYTVSLKGSYSNNCTSTETKAAYIEINRSANSEVLEDDVFVATAFTPNNDGINDELFVRGSDVAEMRIKIFNHQGILIFESDSKNIGWNGRYKNKPAPAGNYFYQLEYVNFLDKKKQIKGQITLLK